LPLLERSRKKEEEKTSSKVIGITELEQICGSEKEIYEALINTMFLDPRKIEISMKEAAENAKKYEKEKNLNRAKAWYEIAGGLAIYEDNVKRVVEFFSESERISGTKYPILRRAEKAVAKAQEYYKKYMSA
jgi:hypothetical protein